MSSEFGTVLKISVFGQSHGRAIGVTIDGLPAGEAIDLEALQAFLDRRRPGTSPLSTLRQEGDRPEFLSGRSPPAAGGKGLVPRLHRWRRLQGLQVDGLSGRQAVRWLTPMARPWGLGQRPRSSIPFQTQRT